MTTKNNPKSPSQYGKKAKTYSLDELTDKYIGKKELKNMMNLTALN